MRRAYRSGRDRDSAPEIQMAAMIDVVFLLLVFFVFTIKPTDVYAKLKADAPEPSKENPGVPPIRIIVSQEHFVINGKNVTLETVGKSLSRIADISSSTCVTIHCTGSSRHARLIRVLDLCEKAGLANISLFTI